MRQHKGLSQVFLQDDVSFSYVMEQLPKSGKVLEIGPGGGILTRYLVQHGCKIIGVEVDQRFFEARKSEFSDHEFLLADICSLPALPEGVSAVVGNIPYHISTDILFWCLKNLPSVVVLLTQKEFAERIASPMGSKSYGSISVFAQLRSQIELGPIVERKRFKPVPEVDSRYLLLRPRVDVISKDLLVRVEEITRLAFHQRRKKISNSLKSKEIDWAEVGINPDLRPERINPETFLHLAKFINAKNLKALEP